VAGSASAAVAAVGSTAGCDPAPGYRIANSFGGARTRCAAFGDKASLVAQSFGSVARDRDRAPRHARAANRAGHRIASSGAHGDVWIRRLFSDD